MLDIVENDFNITKDNNSLMTVTEVTEDIYDSTLSVIAEEFNYLEVL